jgi:S1-C subfamily serine protease
MNFVGPLLLLALAPNPAVAPRGLDCAALVWAKNGALTAQGTGVLLDKKERLLVTAWHVVRGAQTLHVLFPLYEDRQLLTAPLPYQERSKRGQAIGACVVVSDPQRDLAVLQLESVPDGVREVPFAAAKPRPDDNVYFIGNPQVKNILWDRAVGQPLGVRPKTWTLRTGQEVSTEILEVETRTILDGGYSGGPVVNAANELVGVTLAAQEEKSRRVYCVEAGAVRRQLAESYSTLALSGLGTGDGGQGLLAKARHLVPDDAVREGVISVASGGVRGVRETIGGVHP